MKFHTNTETEFGNTKKCDSPLYYANTKAWVSEVGL